MGTRTTMTREKRKTAAYTFTRVRRALGNFIRRLRRYKRIREEEDEERPVKIKQKPREKE
jgi:hypothetical protein